MNMDDILDKATEILEPPTPPNFKIDQVAFASKSEFDTAALKAMFGLSKAEWKEDIVLAAGRVNGVLGANRARLLFNYDLGIELEILQYLEGPNYIDAAGIKGRQMCHLGMHWDGTGEMPRFGGASVIQEVQTIEHTNQFLVDSRRKYRYTIFDTREPRGVFLKVIERIELPNPSFAPVAEEVTA